MKKSTLLFLLTTAIALVPGLATHSLAQFPEWSFDSDAFEQRLQDDWLTTDAAHVESNGPLFEARDDTAPERDLVNLVLDAVREYDPEPAEPLAARLDALIVAKTRADDPQWQTAGHDACRVRRELRLSNAQLAPQFIYTKHYVFGASHYAYTEGVSDKLIRIPASMLSGQLIRATFEDGAISEVSSRFPTPIRDPEVSWDGKIVFSMPELY